MDFSLLRSSSVAIACFGSSAFLAVYTFLAEPISCLGFQHHLSAKGTQSCTSELDLPAETDAYIEMYLPPEPFHVGSPTTAFQTHLPLTLLLIFPYLPVPLGSYTKLPS